MFSDSPCPGAAGASTGVVSNSPSNTERSALSVGGGDYSTLNGDWQGQTQHQASANGLPVEAANFVVPLVLNVSADGKVTGISSSNGCKYLSVASPGVMPAMLNLDVSLSGCSFTSMNRRFRQLRAQQGHANGSTELTGPLFAACDASGALRHQGYVEAVTGALPHGGVVGQKSVIRVTTTLCDLVTTGYQ